MERDTHELPERGWRAAPKANISAAIVYQARRCLLFPRTMFTSPYAEQLRWLGSSQAALTAMAAEAGAQRGWWRADGGWLRCFARFDPLRTAYCTLLFEGGGDVQHFCLIEIHAQIPALQTEHEISLPCAPLGWIKLTRFPHDAALTTLPAVLADAGNVRVVRYRPRLRCTLRVDAAPGSASFAKVFADQSGAAVHAAGLSLWDAAARGELGFHVARPQRWDAATRCLWQGVAPGEPAQPHLLGAHGELLAQELGRSLATLSRSSLSAAPVYDAGWQLARTQDSLRELDVRAPQARAALEEIAAALLRTHAQLGPAAPRPLHGAPHPQQWLVGEQGCSLVDFDRCGSGDAELDVATFVAEVDFVNASRHDVARINEGFVRGFESRAGRLDPLRFGLYRAHKHVAKALRLARSVRVDGVSKAAALLHHLNSQLDAMCSAATARAWSLSSDWKRRAGATTAMVLSELEGFAIEACRTLACVA
jgi:hypothetical protein